MKPAHIFKSTESHFKVLFKLASDHKVNSMPKHAFTAVYSSIYETIRYMLKPLRSSDI